MNMSGDGNGDKKKNPIEDVYEQLRCSREGLTSEEAAYRLEIFGPNKLKEKKQNKILRFLGFSKGNDRVNLAPKYCKVLRDKQWKESKPDVLVPGDIISIKFGDIVPADARLLEGDSILVDESALFGESLPVTVGPGEGVFSGSILCTEGEIEAVVIATGELISFGNIAARPVDTTNNVGHLKKE